ncbi:Aste57867_23172 [Aphanomyces stellatus]|uniref:Aste57867_23172 protein n=1 Tax=Aphanomyces stellatus TaxID=120398 RepID=A0A485LN37_9STRA|nr:hypothetical protein As57867_023101 [Aphanomyces stellatus]VFT99820.1 Aste57867_23172 [Aphanomyces stellatus]
MEGIKGIFRTKPIEVIHAEERKEELPRELGLWDLIAIGIGGTVGSGIFSTAGSIISGQAGPAAFISWAIAGVVSILSGFAYMEMSSLVPSSGSTYAYSYHILGELPAFVAAWLLTLEYGMSGAGVARSWSSKVQEWAEQAGGDYAFLNKDNYNLMAFVVMFLSMLILLVGIKFGKLFINIVTSTKVAVVLFIIVAGFAATKGDNLTPFLPPRSEDDTMYGTSGMLLGASSAFFGYVGFDEVCCMAAEAKNPRKIMPRAVIGTILGTMFLSCFASLALSGMVPASVYSTISATNPYNMSNGEQMTVLSFPSAFGYVGYSAARVIVHIGEVGTMPVVVLVSFLAQPRLLYAMSVDGLLPEIFGRVDKKGNLFWCTLISGTFFCIVAFIVPFDAIWNMVSIGILLSFNMTNSALILARTREGSSTIVYKLTGAMFILAGFAAFIFQKGYMDKSENWALGLSIALAVVVMALAGFMYAKCPQNVGDANLFRAPLVPFIPALAMIINWYLIAQMESKDLGRAAIWIGAAIVAYFLYGFGHSQGRSGWTKMLNHDAMSLNEVRPSMSSMMAGDNMKKSLLTPGTNNVQ